MAIYKNGLFLTKSNEACYDVVHAAGARAPNPGIFKCPGCGHEIVVPMGHTLPAEDHHEHTGSQGSVRWQLIVSHGNYAKKRVSPVKR
jgi:hypothetical protein